ncbi:kynu-1 [Pristionchus pacificus]|uniref:Kynureninase n=1 Tax=Pristionchus pacificus TaxID=54126 RepID=A0A2A6B7D8_PRIPA|nr:kynu-1 [Pristionchus pacificus]|eukprot:PDM61784.1 flu-2 [Pristionchus pacificus]
MVRIDSTASSSLHHNEHWFMEQAKASGMSNPLDVSFAEHLDSIDSLSHLRSKFEYPLNRTLPDADFGLCEPNDESLYLCGNSLGLMPKATRRVVNEFMDRWAGEGVFGHFSEPSPWTKCDQELTKNIAKFVGAEPVEVALMNGLTVNVHILLSSFYNPTATRHKILLESRAFPSDHYAIESQIKLKGYDPEKSMLFVGPREGEDLIRTEDILRIIDEEGDSIAVVFLSGMQYYTGQLFEMEKITKAAQAKGSLVGWDLAHCYINVPLFLHDWNVDFACWCSYKYGSTGPGGLAGIFVHERYRDDNRDRMVGWWGHRMKTRFLMDNKIEFEEGAAGYRISNTPVMLVMPLIGFIETLDGIELTQLRDKSIRLTGYLELLIEHFFSPSSSFRASNKISCESITPKDPNQRGCQLSLKFNISIDRIYKELVKRGVAVDKRYPNIIRVAPIPMYNTFVDVRRFIDVLIEVVNVIDHQ